MSEAQQDQELDKLSREVVRKAGMETPSNALKVNIMSAIQAQNRVRSERKGLLTVKNKITIGCFVMGFCIAIGFLPQTKGLWEIPEVFGYFSVLINRLSYQIPIPFFYGILTFGVLLWVQIGYLKYRLNQF